MFNLLKIKDFAKEINTPESTIRTWKRREEIPAYCFKEIGSTIFVRVSKFKEWVENDT